MSNTNKKTGGVFHLITTTSINLEYAVVLREHPDNPDLLLMCPISDMQITGHADLRLRDEIWRQIDENLWKAYEMWGNCTPPQNRMREKLLEQLINPEDSWVVAHCGNTFWIEADKLTTKEENMIKYKLKMEAIYWGNLSENNLKWLRSVIHKLATGQSIEDDQNWDGHFEFNVECCDEYDKHMRGLEREIHRIEAK